MRPQNREDERIYEISQAEPGHEGVIDISGHYAEDPMTSLRDYRRLWHSARVTRQRLAVAAPWLFALAVLIVGLVGLWLRGA